MLLIKRQLVELFNLLFGNGNFFIDPTKQKQQQGSILKWIIILAVALLIGSYFFDFSLKTAVEDEQTQENFEYVKTESSKLYQGKLKNTVDYLWKDIFLGLLWPDFTENMQRIKDGESTVFDEIGTSLQIDVTSDDEIAE